MIPEREREALMRLTMCAREECGMCKYKDTCDFDFQYETATKCMNILADALRTADRKTEPITHDDYIETENDHLEARCLNCHNAKACKEKHWKGCKYEPWKLTAVDVEPQMKACRECDDYAGDGMYCAKNHIVYDFDTCKDESSGYKKWEAKPPIEVPTEITTCVGVAVSMLEDELQPERSE